MKTKNFENPIRFNSIFHFFVESDQIHFYFLSDRKIKTAFDPIHDHSNLNGDKISNFFESDTEMNYNRMLNF